MRIESFECDVRGAYMAVAGGAEVPFEAAFERARFAGGAEVTAVSYVATGGAARRGRPVAFVTNGGPGSSVCWLHLGFFGPWRVKIEDELRPPAQPPYALEANPHCLLDLCDLVMVDPAGCGFSAAPDEATAPEFHSVDGDAHAVALFIERWIDFHARPDAPVFFVGESYGTVRAAALADALTGGPFAPSARAVCIPLAGIAFLGTAFSTAGSMTEKPPVEEGALALSACAATCAYHRPGRLGTPAEAYGAAWDFAPAYLGALFRGRAMPEAERRAVAERLAVFTCLPADALLARGLRFTVDEVRGAVVPGSCAGAYDGRYLMEGPGNPGSFPFPGMVDPVAEDPAMGAYTPCFVGAMRELSVKLGLPAGTYRAIDFEVNSRWDYSQRRGSLASLENALRRNRETRLLFASGIYDLVCVPGQVRYLVQNSTLPPERVRVAEYESGHMPYLGETGATALERDLRWLLGGAA